MRRAIPFIAAVCVLTAVAAPAGAAVSAKAAREVAELVIRNFTKDAAEETAETLARKIETLAARHGEAALEAVSKVGPRALRVAEEAGEQAGPAVRLMARYGQEGLLLASRRESVALFARYGDEAAEAMIKHKEIAEPVINAFGQPAARALNRVGAQNGRRIATMAQQGDLGRLGRAGEVLDVVGKHGDRAMEFIWKNKGALAVTATLTAFLANPEPFLDGTRDLAKVVGENIARPLASIPGDVVRRTDWTFIVGLCVMLLAAGMAVRSWRKDRRR